MKRLHLGWVCVVCIVALLQAGEGTAAPARDRLVESIDVSVPVAPTLVRIAGRPHIAYELHVTNFSRVDIELDGIEVLDANRGTQLAAYRDTELQTKVARPGRRWDAAQPELLASGARAIVYIWLALDDASEPPSRIVHRFDVAMMQKSGPERMSVHGGATAVRTQAILMLAPPLRGGPWVALYDPSMMGGHRTAIYTLDGRARIPGRYAIDWVRLNEHGQVARADASEVANWYGYGADVLAVADGTIAEAKDDMPATSRLDESQGAMPLEIASGNYIVLDIGDGRYVFYEHLKPGSIKVERGARVRKGEVIAQLGNSGSSSSGPHLHFHVADASSTLAAEGIPYAFDAFEVIGAFDSIGEFDQGKGWKPVSAAAGGQRKGELPAANVVVRFP